MYLSAAINHFYKRIATVWLRIFSKTIPHHKTDKFSISARFAEKKSVWGEYAQLAQKYNPLDLGQGFPDFAAPEYVTESLAAVATSENTRLHQYTRGYGHPRLITVLSKLYSKMIRREINAETEILVTGGAYEALFCSIMGHVDNGDEVIVIEPFFDCYEPMVRSAGGIPRFIPLRFKPTKSDRPACSADWALDTTELDGLFNRNTKLILLNTPHNPFGKVFTLRELQLIAGLCKKWNVLCISDEVYEWIIYKGCNHTRIASLPGMWERTITIGSAGKTFSVTGWKIGWAYGPATLIKNLQVIHQNSVSSCATPIQEAVAMAFEIELAMLGCDQSYFVSLPRELMRKRDFMGKFLADAGMKPIIPEGGYFMVADWSPLASKIDLTAETDEYKDYRFTKWTAKNIGIMGIPPTAFYSEGNKPMAENLVRYCFIKQDEKLRQAAKILKKLKSSFKDDVT